MQINYHINRLLSVGINRKCFCILILFYYAVLQYEFYHPQAMHLNIFLLFFICLIFITIIWLLLGNIIGLGLSIWIDSIVATHYSDAFYYAPFPTFSALSATYIALSMLRCQNMKVNVLMALVPFYNPIALLFKKPRAQNNKNETLTVTAPFEV